MIFETPNFAEQTSRGNYHQQYYNRDARKDPDNT